MSVVSFVLETGLEHIRCMYETVFYLSHLPKLEYKKGDTYVTNFVWCLLLQMYRRVSTKSHMFTIHLIFVLKYSDSDK